MRQKKNRKKLQKKKSDSEDYPTEVLSQQEINQLLTAINEGYSNKEDTILDFSPAKEQTKIKIYDFKRPDKFSKEQIRTLSMIHEYSTRNYSDYLSEILKTDCHIHLASVDQLSYEEFIRSVPTPTTLSIVSFDIIKLEPEKETIVTPGILIEIDPEISRAFINFATDGKGNFRFHRPELTDLEKTIMEEPLVRMMGLIRDTWTTICDARPRLELIETNPAFCQLTPATEMGVLITFEAKIHESEGMITIFYPYITLNPIIHKLNARWYYNSNKEIKSEPINTENIEIDLKFESFRKIETYSFLKSLNIGDIILSNYEMHPTYCKVRNNDIWLFTGIIMEPSPKGPKWNRVRITEIKNITEENYMEKKNNVAVTGLQLDDVQIQLSVELGRTKKTIKEILTWGEGTIVELDTLAGEPCKIFANNVCIALGEVVTIEENFGVRITEMLDPKAQSNQELP
jgi:flagellar motor switch protein FliM